MSSTIVGEQGKLATVFGLGKKNDRMPIMENFKPVQTLLYDIIAC